MMPPGRLARALALVAALAMPDALAWGSDGHRAVGAIADQLIANTNAQRQLAALLLPDENLEQLAIWLDCAKGACGAPTPEMLAYTMANPRHAEYHYTDIAFQADSYRDGAPGAARNDIVHTLRQAIAVLRGQDGAANPHHLQAIAVLHGKNGAANPHHFTPRQALLLIAHLVADMHQPLHVGVPYVGKDGAFVVPQQARQIDGVNIVDTRGGNDLLIDGVRSLHGYWDGALVGYALRQDGAGTPQQFARAVIAGQPLIAGDAGDPAGWPALWADDALQVSKLAHAGLTPGAAGVQTGRDGKPYQVWALTLPADYAESNAALAKRQLTKAGYRLAALLRAIWP